MNLKCGLCQTIGKCIDYGEGFKLCEGCGVLNYTDDKNYSLREWLNFNYQDYLGAILTVLDREKFIDVKAQTIDELKAGKLSEEQINKLRKVLDKAFVNDNTLQELAEAIKKEVKVKDLYKIQDGQLLLKDGEKILQLSADVRASMIARTETTRISALGVVDYYKAKKVKEVKWISSLGSRTCPLCQELDGKVFPINQAQLPPRHTFCRCTIVQVTE